MLMLLLVVNLAISVFNAYQVGRVWIISKVAGGWISLLAWCGAIQSAVGFTVVYAYVIANIAITIGFMDQIAAQLMLALTYVVIIVPALGTGLIIVIQSWITLCRERTLVNFGVTAWNTVATISNTYNAVIDFSDVAGLIKDIVVGGDNDDDDSIVIKAVLLSIIAICLGVLTTYVLINRFVVIPKQIK